MHLPFPISAIQEQKSCQEKAASVARQLLCVFFIPATLISLRSLCSSSGNRRGGKRACIGSRLRQAIHVLGMVKSENRPPYTQITVQRPFAGAIWIKPGQGKQHVSRHWILGLIPSNSSAEIRICACFDKSIHLLPRGINPSDSERAGILQRAAAPGASAIEHAPDGS